MSMLLDSSVDDVVLPASQFKHDWMHAIFIKGVFNVVTYLLFKQLRSEGIADIYSRFQIYVKLWTFPGGLLTSHTLSNIFAQKRQSSNDKAKAFKCQASEGLSVIPLIAFYVMKVFMGAGIAVAACTAFVHLADLVDLISAVATGSVSPETLRDCVGRFLDSCVAAGWLPHMTPKFHWLIHLPRYLARWGMLLSCFVHERKHRMVKRYCNDVQNLKTSEWSVLSEVTCHHLAALKNTSTFNFSVGLLPPVRPASKKMLKFLCETVGRDDINCNTALAARVSMFAVCRTRDVVLLKNSTGQMVAAELWFHASVDGESVSLVSIWEPLTNEAGMGNRTWKSGSEHVMLVPTGDILTPCTYRRGANDVVDTLVPCVFR